MELCPQKMQILQRIDEINLFTNFLHILAIPVEYDSFQKYISCTMSQHMIVNNVCSPFLNR